MSPAAPPKVDEELWSAALLAADTELLLGAARNYLGPVRTPYDKREIVGRLAAFLRRAEVREAVVDLLDSLDARILGSLFLLGPLPESELRTLFEGELPLFDLGIRIANLLDRLLVFRFELGGRRLLAPNPILAEDLEAAVLGLASTFGAAGEESAAEKVMAARAGRGETRGGKGTEASVGTVAGGSLTPVPAGPVTARDVVALFAFLFHAPAGIRKGGGLTKKALERAEGLLPESLLLPPGRLAALLAAFDDCGFLGEAAEAREPDLAAFGTAVESWGEALPAYLAAAQALGPEPAREPGLGSLDPLAEAATALAAALAAAPEGFRFSRGGLGRWIEIALRRARRPLEGGAAGRRDLLEALSAFGLVEEGDEGLSVLAPWAPGRPGVSTASAPAPAPTVVAEGSHALHLLPEAGLPERLLVATLAKPVSFGTVWSFEIDRDSARRAFAAGLSSSTAIERLSAAAGRSLPQSLSFSIKAWEEEYRSLRLYRGFVLVADDRLRNVVEHSRALAPHIAERLAPGVYVLAASGPEEAAALLEEAGLEAPPEIHHGGASIAMAPAIQAGGAGEGLDSSARSRLETRAAGAVAPLAALASRGAAPAIRLDPESRIASLEAALASMQAGEGGASGETSESGSHVGLVHGGPSSHSSQVARGPAELKELADRVQRRLVLTPRQLELADVRPERLEATGLDYLGKVRIVERALRSPGDRLELLYRLPGAEPARVLARPVRLEKTEKGLVLEAEDLGTGESIRVSLGAVSTVRRMRASLFGEDT